MGVATLSAPARKRVEHRAERRDGKQLALAGVEDYYLQREEQRLQREQEEREFNEIMATIALEYSMQVTYEVARRELLTGGISFITGQPIDSVTSFNREVAASVQHLGRLKPAELIAWTRMIEVISEREVEASEQKRTERPMLAVF